jgi:hypothetical protein
MKTTLLKKMMMLLTMFGWLSFITACGEVERIVTDQGLARTYYVDIGDHVDIYMDHIKERYDFDTLKFGSLFRSFTEEEHPYRTEFGTVFINYRNEVIAINTGVAELAVHLYKNGEKLVTVALGKIVVAPRVNQFDDTWVGLSRHNFHEEINKNPSGKFYLADHIDFSQDVTDTELSIPVFSGILINPYNYVIRDLPSTALVDTGLFKILNRARIDGLRFENVDLDYRDVVFPENQSIGVLADEAYQSVITNVSVKANIKSNSLIYYLGGLVGYSEETIYRAVAFEGNIDVIAGYVGGLIGFQNNKLIDRNYLGSKNAIIFTNRSALMTIEYASVKGNFRNTQPNGFKPAAFVGLADGMISIRYAYYDGLLNQSEYFNINPIITNKRINVIFRDNFFVFGVYLTLISNNEIFDSELEGMVYQVSYQDLVSGDQLPDLEGFSMMTSELPRLKHYDIPYLYPVINR